MPSKTTTISDMAEDERTYSDTERRAYVPPPCPKCGHQGDWRVVRWMPTGVGLEPRWTPGPSLCPKCGNPPSVDFFVDSDPPAQT